MKIAIIPARGGSKRIPRKNIREFCGKPMLAWSVAAAIESNCFDEIVVSTDDEEIADTARAWGARTPFMRPANLSDDHTGTIPVVRHAIQWYMSKGITPEAVCCLYATAPFVQSVDLRRGLELLSSAPVDVDYAFSVTSYAFPVQRALRLIEKERVEMLYPEHFWTRSQDLDEAFHDAGQFYWGRTHAWMEGKVIFGRGSVPVVLPRHRVQDIDTLEDWVRAEWLFRAMSSQVDT